MKKVILSLFITSASACMMFSCGSSYKPLSEADITAQATAKFEAEGKAEVDQMKADCAANMAANVEAKANEMLTANAEMAAAK
jgi:hypothetical protein